MYRGSRKRLRRMRWRQNMPVEFWILVAVLLAALFIIVPWIIRHPSAHHH
jgi:hypothetical protein